MSDFSSIFMDSLLVWCVHSQTDRFMSLTQIKIKDDPEKEWSETCSIPDAQGASIWLQPGACAGLTPAPHTQRAGIPAGSAC